MGVPESKLRSNSPRAGASWAPHSTSPIIKGATTTRDTKNLRPSSTCVDPAGAPDKKHSSSVLSVGTPRQWNSTDTSATKIRLLLYDSLCQND